MDVLHLLLHLFHVFCAVHVLLVRVLDYFVVWEAWEAAGVGEHSLIIIIYAIIWTCSLDGCVAAVDREDWTRLVRPLLIIRLNIKQSI